MSETFRRATTAEAEGFYLRMGAERIGTKRPKGRIRWTQPILYLRLAPTSTP